METQQAGTSGCIIENESAVFLNSRGAMPLYGIFLLRASGTITLDFATYPISGCTAVFSTPWQVFHWHTGREPIRALWFHGDYYCIEYHKKEVACNGLLFNNIYSPPLISLTSTGFKEVNLVLDKLAEELAHTDPYSEAVARSYLQLILALSSKAKAASLPVVEENKNRHPVLQFQSLLEQYYILERSPAFYAGKLGLSPNAFSKQCKVYFFKSPSELIQERVILEAKKLIHLSLKSIKEIAATLNFEDEHYFSRYFKKHTGLAPTAFRESVGVSLLAYSSKE